MFSIADIKNKAKDVNVYKGRPIKTLVVGLKKKSGHNNQGHYIFIHHGGGHKRLYRLINFKGFPLLRGEVLRVEYDPNRKSFIKLVRYVNGFLCYVIATQNILIKQKIEFFGNSNYIKDMVYLYGIKAKNKIFKIGNRAPLRYLPVGTIIHNLERYPGNGGIYLRSAGVGGQLIKKFKDINLAIIKLGSKEFKIFPLDCFASIGIVSNFRHKLIKFYKAGQIRWLNRRPVVRGVAKNSVDHPHGGGRGKTSGGRSHVTPFGLNTKGTKTRNPKKSNKLIIQHKIKKKKKK